MVSSESRGTDLHVADARVWHPRRDGDRFVEISGLDEVVAGNGRPARRQVGHVGGAVTNGDGASRGRMGERRARQESVGNGQELDQGRVLVDVGIGAISWEFIPSGHGTVDEKQVAHHVSSGGWGSHFGRRQ
jgi:hypothetical protein